MSQSSLGVLTCLQQAFPKRKNIRASYLIPYPNLRKKISCPMERIASPKFRQETFAFIHTHVV